MEQTYDGARFRRLALYIAERSINDPKFGKTKLAKLLFYADFQAFLLLDRSITGATYARYPMGPVPRILDRELHTIEESQEGVMSKVAYFDKGQQRLVPLQPVDVSIFSGPEIAVVDQVLDTLRDDDARSASQRSHLEPAWRCVDDYEDIPYELAYVARNPSQKAMDIGLEVARRLGISA